MVPTALPHTRSLSGAPGLRALLQPHQGPHLLARRRHRRHSAVRRGRRVGAGLQVRRRLQGAGRVGAAEDRGGAAAAAGRGRGSGAERADRCAAAHRGARRLRRGAPRRPRQRLQLRDAGVGARAVRRQRGRRGGGGGDAPRRPRAVRRDADDAAQGPLRGGRARGRLRQEALQGPGRAVERGRAPSDAADPPGTAHAGAEEDATHFFICSASTRVAGREDTERRARTAERNTPRSPFNAATSAGARHFGLPRLCRRRRRPAARARRRAR